MEKNKLKLWRLNQQQYNKITMKKGELYKEKTDTGDIYICREFNPNTMKAIGTWRGSINNLELLRNQEKIDIMHNRLEEMAKEGIKTRIRLPSLVRDSVNQIVSEMAGHIERQTIYNGETIEKVVDNTIKKHTDKNQINKNKESKTTRRENKN